MAYHIVRPADHDEWLAERMKGLGSSDAGTVMGVSPFSTPLRLYRQKKGIDPPTPESESMRNGHFLEPAVAEWFAAETRSVIDYSTEGDWLAVNDEKEYLRVSPDRLFWPEGAEQTPERRLILEIKSTAKYVDPENLPLYWLCQVQYQMGVMGIHMAAIAWVTSNPRLSFGYAWVSFNPSFYKKLTEVIDHFWNENILKDTEPDPIDEKDISIRWPHSLDKSSVTADETDINNAREYLALSEEIQQKQEKLSELAALIKKKMGESEMLYAVDPETGNNIPVAKFKSINETVFDEQRFKQEKPDEYVKYVLKYFDKTAFKDNDRDNWNAYTKTQKGNRRFAVLLK